MTLYISLLSLSLGLIIFFFNFHQKMLEREEEEMKELLCFKNAQVKHLEFFLQVKKDNKQISHAYKAMVATSLTKPTLTPALKKIWKGLQWKQNLNILNYLKHQLDQEQCSQNFISTMWGLPIQRRGLKWRRTLEGEVVFQKQWSIITKKYALHFQLQKDVLKQKLLFYKKMDLPSLVNYSL